MGEKCDLGITHPTNITPTIPRHLGLFGYSSRVGSRNGKKYVEIWLPHITRTTKEDAPKRNIKAENKKRINTSEFIINCLDTENKHIVANKILEYGQTFKMIKFEPTLNPETNKLLTDDPTAFLFGVIFDQNITADQA
jgi:hypothetical protein